MSNLKIYSLCLIIIICTIMFDKNITSRGGAISHFNSTIKKSWSVTTKAQPFCIFNAPPACTMSVVIKIQPRTLTGEDCLLLYYQFNFPQIPAFNFIKKRKWVKKCWRWASATQHEQHSNNTRIMVATSVGGSESLKIQDPFKQYVKLSRLKIYVLCVCEG